MSGSDLPVFQMSATVHIGVSVYVCVCVCPGRGKAVGRCGLQPIERVGSSFDIP